MYYFKTKRASGPTRLAVQGSVAVLGRGMVDRADGGTCSTRSLTYAQLLARHLAAYRLLA